MNFDSLINLPKITVGQIPAILEAIWNGGRYPVMFWGVHGCGKSASVSAWAKKQGIDCKVINLQAIEPQDLCGIPLPDRKGGINYSKPLLIPTDEHDSSWKGILFFDEITEADPRSKAVLLSLLNERRLGCWHLPKEAMIVAAGNPVEEGSLNPFFSRPMSDRLCHFHVQPNAKEFLEWGAERLHPAVLAHLSAFPTELYGASVQEEYASPSPRSWERVSELLKRNSNPDVLPALIQSILGCSCGTSFLANLNSFKFNVSQLIDAAKNGRKFSLGNANEYTLIRLGYEILSYLRNLSPSPTLLDFQAAVKIMMIAYGGGQGNLSREGCLSVLSHLLRVAVNFLSKEEMDMFIKTSPCSDALQQFAELLSALSRSKAS